MPWKIGSERVKEKKAANSRDSQNPPKSFRSRIRSMRRSLRGGRAFVVAHLLMMPLKVHGQISALPRLVRAFRALEGRRLAAALHRLVATHRALPAVALAAETAAELPLLLVRHTGHEDDTEVVRPRQHLERVRKYDLAGRRGTAAAVVAAAAVVVAVITTAGDVAVAGASVRHRDVGPRHHRRCGRPVSLLRWRLLPLKVGPQQGQECTHACNRDPAPAGARRWSRD